MDAVSECLESRSCVQQQTASTELGDKDGNLSFVFTLLFFHEPAVLAPSKCSLGLFTHFLRVVGCLTTWKGCIKRSACRLRFARAYASAPRVFVINTVSFPAPLLQNICSIEEQERACLWATQHPMRSDAKEKQKCLPPEQKNCHPGLLDKNTLFTRST